MLKDRGLRGKEAPRPGRRGTELWGKVLEVGMKEGGREGGATPNTLQLDLYTA